MIGCREYLHRVASTHTPGLRVVNEGKSIAKVNKKLQKSVIDQVKKTQHKLATQEDIHAAVYYLTGNCHIWWADKTND